MLVNHVNTCLTWNDMQKRELKNVKHISCTHKGKSLSPPRIKLTKCERTKQIFYGKGMVSEGIYIKYSDALDGSVISVMPLTCWQASPPSANTSMKTSWGHGKFVPKKRCPWRVLIAVRPVTIVAICSLFRPAKKIIESEITFLSLFKSEGRVCHWSLHHNGLSPCLCSL